MPEPAGGSVEVVGEPSDDGAAPVMAGATRVLLHVHDGLVRATDSTEDKDPPSPASAAALEPLLDSRDDEIGTLVRIEQSSLSSRRGTGPDNDTMSGQLNGSISRKMQRIVDLDGNVVATVMNDRSRVTGVSLAIDSAGVDLPEHFFAAVCVMAIRQRLGFWTSGSPWSTAGG